QGGEFIGHHPDLPAGAIGFATGIPKRKDLRRRHVLVAFGKRVLGRIKHFNGRGLVIAWPLAAFRGNDDPASNQRIFSQLWHKYFSSSPWRPTSNHKNDLRRKVQFGVGLTIGTIRRISAAGSADKGRYS